MHTKIILLLSIITLFACQTKNKSGVAKEKEDLFRVWLRDTLKQVDKTDVIDLYIDSLGLEITKTINEKIKLDSVYFYPESSDIHKALWNLEYINDMPKKDFQLLFTKSHIFTPSLVEQLFIENFWLWIDFNVIIDSDTIKYDTYRGGLRGRLNDN